MIELLLLSSALGDLNEDGSEKKTDTPPVYYALSLLLSACAAYISWKCNTARHINPAAKILYALVAFLFGGLYIIMYAFMTWGYCLPPAVKS